MKTITIANQGYGNDSLLCSAEYNGESSSPTNYWEAGYHAVMITDTAFYRNSNYHTLRDASGTLDYKRMAMAVEGVYAAALA